MKESIVQGRARNAPPTSLKCVQRNPIRHSMRKCRFHILVSMNEWSFPPTASIGRGSCTLRKDLRAVLFRHYDFSRDS